MGFFSLFGHGWVRAPRPIDHEARFPYLRGPRHREFGFGPHRVRDRRLPDHYRL